MKLLLSKCHFKYLPCFLSYMGVAIIFLVAAYSYAQTQDNPGSETDQQQTDEVQAVAAEFVGSETCSGCHEEIMDQFNREALEQQFKKDPSATKPSKVFHGLALSDREKKDKGHLCEGCHGPGSVHIDDPSDEATRESLKEHSMDGSGCLTCHESIISPGKWKRSLHHKGDIGCIECHGQKDEPHADLTREPSSDRCFSCHQDKLAQFAMPYHHPVKEGRVNCSDCHDPHDEITDTIKHDVCITCHADKKGPFIFEHGAISGDLTDACLDCHSPHGSPNQNLQKLSNRGLCLQCHGDRVNHFVGRQCWDCHEDLHGSNRDPLFFN